MGNRIGSKDTIYNGRRRAVVTFTLTSTGGNGALAVSGDENGFVLSATYTAIGLITLTMRDKWNAMAGFNFGLIEATPAGSQVAIKTATFTGAQATFVLATGAAGAYAAKYIANGDKIAVTLVLMNKVP